MIPASQRARAVRGVAKGLPSAEMRVGALQEEQQEDAMIERGWRFGDLLPKVADGDGMRQVVDDLHRTADKGLSLDAGQVSDLARWLGRVPVVTFPTKAVQK